MLRHVCCTGIFLFPPFVVLATAGARRVRRRRLGRGPMPVKVLAARPLWFLGAWALGISNARAGYEQLRDQASSQWQQWLLDTPNADLPPASCTEP